MQIYVMDGDYEVLKKLEAIINTNPKRKAKCFTNIKSLMEAIKQESPDAVLIDFDMQNSHFAVNTIKSESPDTKIVMMTKDRSQTIALFELDLNGYLLKPISDEKTEEQLFRLKHPILSRMMPDRAEV